MIDPLKREKLPFVCGTECVFSQGQEIERTLGAQCSGQITSWWRKRLNYLWMVQSWLTTYRVTYQWLSPFHLRCIECHMERASAYSFWDILVSQKSHAIEASLNTVAWYNNIMVYLHFLLWHTCQHANAKQAENRYASHSINRTGDNEWVPKNYSDLVYLGQLAWVINLKS